MAGSPVAEFMPDWPMGFLRTYGPRADPATTLTWGLMDLSIAVCVIVTALVVAGVLARRVRGAGTPAIGPEGGGLSWLYVGLALTVVALAASLLWTVQVLAEITSPPGKPALTLEVTGHQWWWEVRYLSDDPQQEFTSANEIHVPVGQPVLIKLKSADVIHSFWVPALTGKTETIPGRTNLSWLQADRAGVFRGQCLEYCGAQHAHMALFVIAQPKGAFDAWRTAQLAPATAPAAPDAVTGQAVFQTRCGACHTVRGTDAAGIVGPDLSHLAERRTLAAGLLPNSPASLAGWISDPQSLKPGSNMPATQLSAPQLNAVVAYLETLR